MKVIQFHRILTKFARIWGPVRYVCLSSSRWWSFKSVFLSAFLWGAIITVLVSIINAFIAYLCVKGTETVSYNDILKKNFLYPSFSERSQKNITNDDFTHNISSYEFALLPIWDDCNNGVWIFLHNILRIPFDCHVFSVR